MRVYGFLGHQENAPEGVFAKIVFRSRLRAHQADATGGDAEAWQ